MGEGRLLPMRHEWGPSLLGALIFGVDSTCNRFAFRTSRLHFAFALRFRSNIQHTLSSRKRGLH
eukprot:scaffold8574_cov85-Skeletonema_marinoi.AAC.1